MSEKIKEVLKESTFLLQYLGCITAVVYLIGYLFISGVNAGFISKEIFNVYSFNKINILDKTYILTGIKYSIKYVFHIFIGSVLGYFFIFTLKRLTGKEKVKSYIDKVRSKDSKCLKIIFELKDSLKIFIIDLLNIGIVFIIYSYVDEYNYNLILHNLLYEIYFFIVFIGIYVINSSKKKSVIEKLFILESIGVMIIVMAFIIIHNGMYFTLSKMQKYSDGQNEIDVAEIYYKDKTCEEFISIEKTDREFIGYSFKCRNVKILDNSEIDSINYKDRINTLKDQNYEKYIDNSDKEKDKVKTLIESYYNNKKDGDKFYSWIKDNSTEEYFLKVGKNIDSVLLDNQYNLSKEKEEMNDFIGENISNPDLEQEEIAIKVIEVWKERCEYKEFNIIRDEDSSFKIDNIVRSKEFAFY